MTFGKIRKKMLSGEVYDPLSRSLIKKQLPRLDAMREFNTLPCDKAGIKKRIKILKKNFKKVGRNCYIEAPLHANMGGLNTEIGNDFYANFNLTMVDDGKIVIGDNVMIGPNCTLITANHPVSPELRKKGIQYNKPIYINDNVWLGANVTVMPGVTIGKNSIIGACSNVTKDIPENVIAYGNPAVVVRRITEDDYKYYDHDKKIPKRI